MMNHKCAFLRSLSNSQAHPKWQALFSGFKRTRPSDLKLVVNDRLYVDSLLPLTLARVTNVVSACLFAVELFRIISLRRRDAQVSLSLVGEDDRIRTSASRLRSMRLTVPAAINFTRPRGTPIHARSLQLPFVVSSLLAHTWIKIIYTYTYTTSIGARNRKKKRESTYSHTQRSRSALFV